MKVQTPALFRFFGFNTQGDMGPWTFYTSSRKQLVMYLRAHPKEPASHRQIRQRNRFRLIAWQWQRLPQESRDAWEAATKAAHLRIMGFNLFTYWLVTHDAKVIATIERQAGVTLDKSAQVV